MSWQSPECAYTAASLVHKVPVPVAAAVQGETRQQKSEFGACSVSEGWML